MTKFVILDDGMVFERESAYISCIEKRTRPIEWKYVKRGFFDSGSEAVKYKTTYYFTVSDAKQEYEYERESEEELLKIWKDFIDKFNG